MADIFKLILGFFVLEGLKQVYGQSNGEVPPFIKQCRSDAKDVGSCLVQAFHHIRPFLARGIPEIRMPAVEPFRMDELSLSLTTGPNGYRVTLRDIDVFGASNFTASSVRLSQGRKPFEVRIVIPKMRINSKYASTGVLIILPATGNGTFHAVLSDVSTVCRGFAAKTARNGVEYLHIDSMEMDLDVKHVRMMVKKVYNSNRILTEATNLFLKENGLEVLKAMSPQLRKKLAAVFMQIGNQIFDNVPLDMIYKQV